MKRFILFFLIIASFVVTSCDSTPITISEDKRKIETTIQLQEMATKDTLQYKVVPINRTLYIINPKTNLVEMKIDNDSGYAAAIPYLVWIMLFLLIVALVGLIRH